MDNNKIDWKRKLTSRKFWMAVSAFVGLLIIHFTGNETEAKEITEIIMAGAVVIGYIIGEGLADSGTFYIESSGKETTEEDGDGDA
jgi:hypothetical protein